MNMRYAWMRRLLRKRGLTIISDEHLRQHRRQHNAHARALGDHWRMLVEERRYTHRLENEIKEARADAEGWRLVAERVATERAREAFCDGS